MNEQKCEGTRVPSGIKNKGLNTQPMQCGRPAKHKRGDKWYCGTCLNTLEGIKPARRPPRTAKKMIEETDAEGNTKRRAVQVVTEARRGAVMQGQLAMFDLSKNTIPDRLRIRQVPGQEGKGLFDVWWAEAGGPTQYTRQYIEENYPALMPMLREAEQKAGWVVEQARIVTDN